MPYIGRSTDGFGIRERFTYVVSANATSISGADANGRTLLFEDPEYVDVFLNGVRLKKGTDYDTNTANTINNLAALAASDEVEVIVHDVFTLADMVSANNGGDFRGNLGIVKDSAVLTFGLDKDITLTHDADKGLKIKNTSTTGNSGVGAVLTLQTGDTDIAVNNVLGDIQFQAPDEGTGTDAILVAAAIKAMSEGDFSSSNNATKLSFHTAASAAAAETMSLSSAGVLTTSSNIVSGGTITGSGLLTTGGNVVIPDAGTIGSASDTNAIAISSAGVITISTNTDSSNSTTGALVAHSAGFADDVNIGDQLNVAGAIAGSSTIIGTTITAQTAFVPDSSDGGSLGTASLEFSDLFLADAATIQFGADQDINITHVADTGLTTNGTFTAAGITSSSTLQGTTVTATTAFVPDSSGGADLGTTALEFNDLYLNDAGSVIFGNDQDVSLEHDHNVGLIISRSNQSDNSPVTLVLQTGETDIAADDVIGKFAFQAPDESTGTDAVLVAAAIQARSEGDFSSSANATSIDFMTGASEAAATKMSLTSGGDLSILTDGTKISFGASSEITLTHVHNVGLTLTHTATDDNLPIILQLKSEENEIVANEVIGSLEFAAGDADGTDGATVAAGIHAIAEGTFSASANATKLVFTTGVSETAAASATAKMTLSSAGLLTIADDFMIKDGGTIGVASDADAITIASNGQVTFSQTLIGTALDISGDIDVDGTTNLDIVDIDGAVDMASTLQVDGAITSSAGATITVADNSAGLTIVSTDADANVGPSLNLYRNSSSPADADLVGNVKFQGENSAGETIDYVTINGRVEDVTDGTEDGRIDIRTITAGADVSRIKVDNNEVVLNDSSIDSNFRVESNNLANMLFVDGGVDKVYIGRNASDGKFSSKLQIEGIDSTAGMSLHRATNDSGPPYLAMSKSRAASFGDDTVVQSGDGLGTIYWSGADGTDRGSGAAYIAGLVDGTPGSDDMPGRITFGTTADGANSPSERMRIDSAGNIYSNVTVNPVSQGGTTETGQFFGANSYAAFGRVGGIAAYFNRQNNDGDIVAFRQDGSDEGTISISGTTTSYNAFSGSHWSRLTDNSKPIILKGTIIETIDEMCDWYQAKFTIPAITSKDEEGNEIQDAPEQTIKDSIALPSGKKVGDTISHTYEGVTYDNAVIIKEGDNKHPKCKISDTADSKRVYGVHADWDNDDDTVNDMYVTAVGTHVVRINKDVTVSAGDLLSSNGDGTAKVQDDDIIRSKTLGKVLTNIKQETYDDGSYTVPCALYCG